MSEDSVARNAGFAFATKMVGAALTAGLTIFLGRTLSPQGYGDFAFAMGVLMFAGLLSDLAITASASRYLGERRNDTDAAADVFRTAFWMKVVLAIGTSVLLLALAAPLCKLFSTPSATGAVRGIAVSLFFESLFLLVLSTFGSVARIRFNAIIAFWESMVEVTASILLVLAGAGAAGAAFGRAMGYAVGLTVGLLLIRRVLGPLRRRPAGHEQAVSRRTIGTYAAAMIPADAAFRAFDAIDILLIAALLGGGAPVAAFQLPMRLVLFLDYPASAVSAAVAPRFSRGPDGPDMVTFLAALRFTMLLQVVFVPPMLIWPEALIHIPFGDRYPDAADVLRGLVPFVVLSGLAQLVTVSVNYLGEGARRWPIAVVMLSANVVIDIILLPRIGIVGAAIGTSVAYAIWVPAHVWVLRRHAGLPLRPIFVTGARSLIAAAAMCGVLALLGTGLVPLWRMAIGAVLGPAVYVGVLILTRELHRRDLTAIMGLVGRGRTVG
ncbi:MAG TPA: polysaccharide biosynthesis C-terminal domain-containing protein [Baekduia sp.]